MSTVKDLEKLGYTVAVAHGSADTEREALAAARHHASPERVQDDVTKAAESVAEVARAKGLVGQEMIDVVTRAAAQALATITVARNSKVEFHERALQHALDTPDVMVISGPGVDGLMVKCKPDGTGWDDDAQAVIDSLADSKAHKERVTQHEAS